MSFAIAASVLAVLFGVIYSFGDVLPIPTSFRDVLGIASAETTDPTVLSPAAPTVSPAEFAASVDSTATASTESSATASSEATATVTESGTATDSAATDSVATADPSLTSGEATGSADTTVPSPGSSTPAGPDLSGGEQAEALETALRTDVIASDSALPAMAPSASFALAGSAFATEPSLSAGDFDRWMSTPTTLTLTPPAGALYTLYRVAGAAESPYLVYESPLAFTDEGAYTVYFYSYSSDLAEMAQYRTIKIDSTAPAFGSGASVLFRTPTMTGFTVAFTRAADALSGVDHYQIVSERFASFESTLPLSSAETSTAADSATLSGLEAGTYRVSIRAVDLAGNESSPISAWVMVGQDRPVVTLSFEDTAVAQAVASDAWITWGTQIALSARVTSPAPSYRLTYTDLGGASHTSASIDSSPVAVQQLTLAGEGARTVTVLARDTYGLESTTVAVVLKVDRTAPSAVQLLRARQIAGTTNVRVNWGEATDQTSGVDHYVVSLIARDGTTVFGGATSLNAVTIDGVSPGSYELKVVAIDVAGNTGAAQTIQVRVADSSTAQAAQSAQTAATSTPSVTATATPPSDTTDSGASSTPRAGAVTIDDSNRLYWIIGAAGVLIGLAILYVAAVTRAFSGKDES